MLRTKNHILLRTIIVFLLITSQSFYSRVLAQIFSLHEPIVIAGNSYRFQDFSLHVHGTRGYKIEPVATFPTPTIALMLKYRPTLLEDFHIDTTKEEVMEYVSPDASIGAIMVLGDRMWVGLSFYEGEGSHGIGGIGFFDPLTGKIDILRHPALLDVATHELFVTQDTIFAKTFSTDEGSETYGNGLVCISRKTLEAVARVPLGGEVLSDREDSNVQNKAYQRPIVELISDRSLVYRKVPNWSNEERKNILSLGLDEFMINTAIAETNSK